MASNVVPLRAPLREVPDDAPEDSQGSEQADQPEQALAKQEPPAMSTAKKVGIGAGILTATGLVGLAAYKLGVRMGWWGADTNPIIIDDPQDKTDGKPGDDARPIDGGGSTRVRAVGKPPNVSGDSHGYNTQRYPHPGAVRLTMTTLGYKVEFSGETLVPDGEPNPEVKLFQNEWNKVIRGLDSGKVKFASPVDDSTKLAAFRGLLDPDGIPGKNTLNAMEVAFNNQLKNKMSWPSLVRQA